MYCIPLLYIDWVRDTLLWYMANKWIDEIAHDLVESIGWFV
jgi:hypothetical protein